MKLSELTEEQINSFPTYVDKFVKIGLDTSPFNKDKALEAVKLAYQCANLTPPDNYLFVKSPLIGNFLVKKTKLNNFIIPFYGSFEVNWLAKYAFFRDNGFAEETKPLSGLFKCMKECGWVWFYDNLCIITEKPIFISRNENGDLHNLEGPALKYSDSYSLYFINGKSINKRYFKRISFYLKGRKKEKDNSFSLEKELSKQLLNNQVSNQVCNQVFNQVYNQVYNQVCNQVFNQVYNQVYNQVIDQVCNQVFNQVYNQVSNQVCNQVYNQVCNQVFNQVFNQVYNQVCNQVYNQVSRQVRDQVNQQVSNKFI